MGQLFCCGSEVVQSARAILSLNRKKLERRMQLKKAIFLGLAALIYMTSLSASFAEELNSDAQQATPVQQRPPTAPPERTQKQRKIEGSMVGYIDNALIGSHVR